MSKLLLALIVLAAVTSAFGADNELGIILVRVYAGPDIHIYRPFIDSIPGSLYNTNVAASMYTTEGFHDVGVDVFVNNTVIWSNTRYSVWVEAGETTVVYFNTCTSQLP